MFVSNSKHVIEMHQATIATLCTRASYWAEFTSDSNEQNPINVASFYKESGN